MKMLKKETEANFNAFSKSFKDSAQAVAAALESHADIFLESYRRIASIQAWRVELQKHVSSGSLAFFLEAQNDALTSHVLARFGAWRSSLKSLRSCIENTTYCLYYKDHPVELKRWELGKHRPGFSRMRSYLAKHPDIDGLSTQDIGLDFLGAEYSILSRAVHSSAKPFRMTAEDAGLKLWSAEVDQLGKWNKRERSTITGINLLLMSFYRDKLQGTRSPNLRKAISLVIPEQKHKRIKETLSINLFTDSD